MCIMYMHNVYVYVCMYIYIYIYMHMLFYIYIYICIYTYTVNNYVHMYIYISYISLCTYTLYTYTYTHLIQLSDHLCGSQLEALKLSGGIQLELWTWRPGAHTCHSSSKRHSSWPALRGGDSTWMTLGSWRI